MLYGASSTAQNTYTRVVDFKLDQDGVSLSGSATLAAEFAFLGAPYLKVKYADLTIKTLSYKNKYLSSGSNRDILAFPYKPENGGYYVNAEMIVSIAYVDLNGGLAVKKNLMSNTFDDNVKSFTIKDKIYTLTDTYSNKAIDDYFRQLNHPKYKAADFWERSALIDAKITGLSPNIIRQMTTIIDAKLREKEQEKQDENKDKKQDSFDDFLSGNNKADSNKKSVDNGFDEFLSGKKTTEKKNTVTKPNYDFDDFLSGEKPTKDKKTNTKPKDDFDDFLNGEITSADRNDFKIESMDGKQGVVSSDGKTLIPFEKWEIKSYDPASGLATISKGLIKQERFAATGCGAAESRTHIYIREVEVLIVDQEGSVLSKARQINIWGYIDRTLYWFSDATETKKLSNDDKKCTGWLKSEIPKLIKQYENKGFQVDTKNLNL